MRTREQCDEAARHRAVTRTRLPLLHVLAVVLMVGLAALLVAAPAQAVFNRLATAPATVGTLTVADPATVSLSNVTCTGGHRLTLRLSWAAVPGAGSYLVTPYVDNVAQTPVTVSGSLFWDFASGNGPSRDHRFSVKAIVSTWSGAPTSSLTSSC